MKSYSNITARYAETDQMGIIHHSVYPVWYEVARTDFIKKLGLSYSEMEKIGVKMPLLHLECTYKSAARYEDELTIETVIRSLTPVRIEFFYTVYKKGTEKPINFGSTQHALTNQDLKPMNMKKKHPDLFTLISSAIEKNEE